MITEWLEWIISLLNRKPVTRWPGLSLILFQSRIAILMSANFIVILFYLKLLCGHERRMFKAASLMISISKLCTACHQNSIRFSGWKLSKKINSNKKKEWKLVWLLAVWNIITPHEQIIPLLTTSLSLNKVSMPMVKWILLGSWNILASIPRHCNNNIDNYASLITSTEIKGLRDRCPQVVYSDRF